MTDNATATHHPLLHESLHLADATAPLQLERRRYRRHAVQQRVTAAIASRGRASEADLRICSLLLTDLSAAGAGAMVQEPLPLGAPVTLFCPAHGAQPGSDRRGTIVRCRRLHDAGGYSLGIKLDARLAA